MDISIERWKPVAGYIGFYEVSDQGRVRSLDRYAVRTFKDGRSFPAFEVGTMLAEKPNRKYYKTVSLTRPGQKVRVCGIHVLVLETFVGPRPKGYQVAHQNGNQYDNRLVNLKSSTVTENMRDKLIHGTQTRGENHAVTKLSEEQVIKAVKTINEGGWGTASKVARELGVSPGAIQRILCGKNWAHLGVKDNRKVKRKVTNQRAELEVKRSLGVEE